MTGITVPDEVQGLFNDFKLKRTPHFAMFFKIEGDEVVEDTEMHVPKEGSDFDSILEKLDESTPRYVVIDFNYETTDGRPADKIIFVAWIPDTCKIKDKMKYSGTKESVKSAFVGIAVNINATDMSEVTVEEVTAACNKV
mmetsp:Transcript_73757/g.210334  ORF Transcript_73757/g.210334 Transcript_73757/m.210334 type:complete len:140 (+) Transcript_73757:212-631(+)|eukprot:CAMPEP_0119474172 /NCGR_PEP_ID=MMETSP1344-20130328/5527_1 /TAXON_ID=236787 /ORGANISM="Florenciella parvula, Strain CCMP2471" /LENGTH=139 /DNA_ID=CAMNT_0007507409 /DNA_START=208 /DNA_END=627 /DNA_ORIENTATION=-